MTHNIKNDSLDNCIITYTSCTTCTTAVLITIVIFVACCRKTNKKENATILNRVTCSIRNYKESETEEMENRKNKLQCKVKWVTSKREIKVKSKFLLLCNVTSRIPDDLEDVLKDLSIEGETLGNDIRVVAMHRSESGKLDSLSNVIETRRNNRLHLINIFYCGNITFECDANETAKREMEKFLHLNDSEQSNSEL
nr:uncharacterized protein LOC117686586 isoform X2 [Crassostrea gigas]XP_034317691.1 uncharacterized protein LOC117686586 isoform X2 [Crassostrea gigas]